MYGIPTNFVVSLALKTPTSENSRNYFVCKTLRAPLLLTKPNYRGSNIYTYIYTRVDNNVGHAQDQNLSILF